MLKLVVSECIWRCLKDVFIILVSIIITWTCVNKYFHYIISNIIFISIPMQPLTAVINSTLTTPVAKYTVDIIGTPSSSRI